MENKHGITLEQTSVLLWIKALNDFTDVDNAQDTLGIKLNKFDVESADFERADFICGIEALCKLGVLKQNEEEQEIELTMAGKSVLNALSTIKCLSDEAIHKILNGTINMVEFVKEHGIEIMSVVSGILIKF